VWHASRCSQGRRHARASGCAVIRQAHLIAVVGAFLIAGVVVGCASAQGNIDDERGGEEGAAVTNEETTAPKGGLGIDPLSRTDQS
jgi:hypothetical protein